MSSDLSMELFLFMTGTRMLHVPYKGPVPGLIDLLAGRVSAMATSTGTTRVGRGFRSRGVHGKL